MSDSILNQTEVQVEAEAPQSENEEKANKLFQNIERLKDERRGVNNTIDDLLIADSDYSSLVEEKQKIMNKLKLRKNLLESQSNQLKSLYSKKKELTAEIKNDKEVLNDFIEHSVRIGEQMRLFDLDKEENVALANYKIKKKRNL